jgi:succinoglycan biosynthesis protein ExoA
MSPAPRLSVIIPVRQMDCRPAALDTLSRKVGLGTVEVLVAPGGAPARQRNAAVGLARSELLYFLDDDSRVDPEVLLSMVERFERLEAAALGGPAQTRGEAGLFETCVGEVTASMFGSGITRARAVPVGQFRQVEGEELVSSNLLMSRSWFQRVGGLDEGLYPGEDVDLMKKLRNLGAKMYYSPEARVERERCKSMPELISQTFRYAQGRGLRFFRHARPEDLIFFLPVLFLLNVLLWKVLPVCGLLLYGALSVVTSLEIGWRLRSPVAACLCAVLFPVQHLSHGMGMLVGLLGYPMRHSDTVEEIRVHTLDL